MKNYRETLDVNNKKVYDLFKKYKPESNTFIETGCHLGGGITKAINAGYNKIYSCVCQLQQNQINYKETWKVGYPTV